MSRQRGTNHKGSTRRSKAQRSMGLMMKEGYETGVSMSDKDLINECESCLVTEHLGRGRGGGKINHY